MSIRPVCRPTAAKFLRMVLVATFALTFALTFNAFGTGSTAQAQGSKTEPIAIVTLNSINNLLEDVNFIGSLAGQPRMADQVRPFVGMLQGLDNDQPIGLVLQSDGVSPGGAICIPVTDLKMLLGGLQMFGIAQEDGPAGTIKISGQGQQLFAKEANGWAYVSMMPQMLDNVPNNPGELFGELTKDYDFGVRLFVQNIPEAFKQMALGQLQMGMEAGMKKLDTESDEQFEARQAMSKAQVDQLKQAAQDLESLTFGLAIDSEQQRTFIDMAYTATAGTKLADQIALNSDPKTDFAGFFQPDAAMMMSFASKIADADLAQMEQMFEALSKQISTTIAEEVDTESQENNDLLKSAANDFLQSFRATVEAGKMDGGAVLNVSPTSLSFVAGGFNADPTLLESGLKKLVEIAKDEEKEKFPGVNWNSASHADVQFHTMSLPIPADEGEAHELFGDTLDMAVGIGKETAFFAVGRDCVQAIKDIIDTSAASPQKSVPPMEMSFALAQIMEAAAAFVPEDDKPQIEMLANMLTNEANGRDHVRMVVQPVGNGVRFRIEAEEGVLRAAGMAAQAAQMKKMQAAGAGGF